VSGPRSLSDSANGQEVKEEEEKRKKETAQGHPVCAWRQS
jgi:hypothetical protein